MDNHLSEILKKYWGHSNFRPSQKDIINSVLKKEDTLALLPTGGGKSICFQIPALVNDGLALVISPLVALMNDQVTNLKSRDIPATAITSSMSFKEIDIALENAANGKYKFLYLSPERLQNELFLARLKRMTVNLIAVDEAHCISQWGYDFRPPYLEILKIRDLLPNVPVLALTATATENVVEDIQEKLGFKKKHIIRNSFFRSNVFYNVLKTEQKWAKTLEIFKKIQGSGIIYSRNRKNTIEIAQWLQKSGVSADYYHAGLPSIERDRKQSEWLENKTRIMVCTNAFGMGIDKPNVRLVVHLELPDSIESYFQEAGRAGRDLEKAYSIVIVDPSDIDLLKMRYLDNFPDLAFIRKVYQSLGNHLQLALGSGENTAYGFELDVFCRQYSYSNPKTYNAIKILEKEGFLFLSDDFGQSSKLFFKADRTAIYDYQVRNSNVDALIKVLFRSYGGLDIEYTSINEWTIAQRLKSNQSKVKLALEQLHNQGMVDYIPGKNQAEIRFLRARQKTDYLEISDENLKNRFKDLKQRIQSVIDYISEDNICRSIGLLSYFGEKSSKVCGQCDICRSRKIPNVNFEEVKKTILELLEQKEQSLNEIKKSMKFGSKELISIIQILQDEGLITEKNEKYIRII